MSNRRRKDLYCRGRDRAQKKRVSHIKMDTAGRTPVASHVPNRGEHAGARHGGNFKLTFYDIDVVCRVVVYGVGKELALRRHVANKGQVNTKQK